MYRDVRRSRAAYPARGRRRAAGRRQRRFAIDDNLLAIGRHCDDRPFLTTVRRNDMAVAVFGNFFGASHWIDKFHADEITWKIPASNGSRTRALDVVKGEFGIVVGA